MNGASDDAVSNTIRKTLVLTNPNTATRAVIHDPRVARRTPHPSNPAVVAKARTLSRSATDSGTDAASGTESRNGRPGEYWYIGAAP